MTTSFCTRQFGFSLFAVWLAFSALLVLTSFAFAKPAGPIIVNSGDSIQAAIDSAKPGDTILINPGSYGESLTLSKAVSLTGVNSATVIIQAVANQRVLTVTGAAINSAVVISGLTLTEGNAYGTECPAGCGGGILVEFPAEPHLRDLKLVKNQAEQYGGGLYFGGDGNVDGPFITLTHLSAVDNTAGVGGGAYVYRRVVVTDSYFEGNVATVNSGGGLEIAHNAVIEDSEFVRNVAVGAGGGASIEANGLAVRRARFVENVCLATDCVGGGLHVIVTLNLMDTQFISNTAGQSGGGALSYSQMNITRGLFERNACVQAGCDGGGLWTDDQLVLDHTRFISNTAQDEGGGAWSYGQVTSLRSMFQANQAERGGALSIFGRGWYIYEVYRGRIVNSLFVDNSAQAGAALYLHASGDLQILHTTIADPIFNSAAAVEIVSGTSIFVGKVGITNTIIVSHAVGISRTAGLVSENYNLFFGNTRHLSGTMSGGTHDVYGKPDFVNPALDNYWIISTSAAIDTAVNVGIFADLDGNRRPARVGFDIGAYESQFPFICLPVIRQ
jgi:hypothetical protein